MTVDASTLVAIERRADGWERLVAQVMEDGHARVPATALAEAGMLLVAEGDLLDLVGLAELVDTLKLTVVPFTDADWREAVLEYRRRREGRATGPARFGDCLTAAVAARTGAPVAEPSRGVDAGHAGGVDTDLSSPL